MAAAYSSTLLPLLAHALPPTQKRQTCPAPSFPERRSAYLSAVRTKPVGGFELTSDGAIRFTIPDPGKRLWNHLLALLSLAPSGNLFLSGWDGKVTARQLARVLVTLPNQASSPDNGPVACLMRHPHLLTLEDRRSLFTSEGVERHLAINRYNGYLYCQHWLRDHPEDALALEALKQARSFILQHARDTLRTGTSEEDSSAYYSGILLCFEFARDAAVRMSCQALLDVFATEQVLKYMGEANPSSEADASSSLWWGDSGVSPVTASNAVFVALSSYRPPSVLGAIARKEFVGKEGAWYLNSHPSSLLNDTSYTRETLYLGPYGKYALSCTYPPPASPTHAPREFRPAKLVSRTRREGESALTLSLNDNSPSQDGGGRGPYTYWAQYRNVLFQITTVPVRTENIQSYVTFPAGGVEGLELSIDDEASLFFVHHDDTYIAFHSLTTPLPHLEQEEAEKGKGKGARVRVFDTVPTGGIGGLIVEVGTKDEQHTFSAFQKRMREAPHLDRDRWGQERVILYTSLRGEQIEVRPATSIRSPGGGIPSVTVNGKPLGGDSTFLDLRRPWPIFSGPNIRQAEGVLTVSTGKEKWILRLP